MFRSLSPEAGGWPLGTEGVRTSIVFPGEDTCPGGGGWGEDLDYISKLTLRILQEAGSYELLLAS